MICILCKREMEVEDEREDNPYVDSDIHVCNCGYSCERTFFGAGSDEPSEIDWFDDEGDLIEVYEKHCNSY